MEISCAFPTALDSPDRIALAEELGYDRAWLYDTPQQSTDVWVTLALAAERTERIGLGPGVLVPTLRPPPATPWSTPRPPPISSRWLPAGSPSPSGPASPVAARWAIARFRGRSWTS